MTGIELLSLELLTSLNKYTRAMFKAQYKRNFIINDHFLRIFEVLQDVVDGKITRLIINMPPRYGKTEVVVKAFISWCFALNPTCKFLHLSYSDMLVNDNSNTIRQIMQEPLYQTLFPGAALDKGASNRWKTKAGGELYAVSTQGQVTGFGAGKVDNDEDNNISDYLEASILPPTDELREILSLLDAKQSDIFEGGIVIDDPLKPEDALSDTIRERINNRFENTIRNRTNSRKTPIVLIMQRLHEHDLTGYLLEKEPDEWTVLALPAILDLDLETERPLWELKHTVKELRRMRDINSLVFDTQYMQDPTPREGLMYPHGFGTYTREQLQIAKQSLGPKLREKQINYTDTADTGSDSLCSICAVDTPEFIYVTDIIFTDEPMEVTEPATANLLSLNRVGIAKIEGNNGGRGFARNVTRIMRVTNKNFSTRVITFTQTNNKFVRIFSHSAEVSNMILFPEDWDRRWPKFYKAISLYRKDNKRKTQHDDAADCLTGIMEMHTSLDSSVRKKVKSLNNY